MPGKGRGRPRKFLEVCRPSVAGKAPGKPTGHLCGCGCGEVLEQSLGRGRARKFVQGHNRAPTRPPVPRPATGLCACGCGGTWVQAPGRGNTRKFIDGHNPVARPKTVSRSLQRAWKRITAWTEYAACSPSVVPAPDPDVVDEWFIYKLVDPRDRGKRYVGQSTRGIVRPREHRSKSKHNEDNLYLKNWVNELRRCGLTFEIMVLEVVPDGDLEALNAAEVKWIAHGRAEGWRLTNLTEGGGGHLGLKKTPEQIEAMRARVKEANQRKREERFEGEMRAFRENIPLWRAGRATRDIRGSKNPMNQPGTKKVTGAAHHMKRPEVKLRHKEAMQRVGLERIAKRRGALSV